MTFDDWYSKFVSYCRKEFGYDGDIDSADVIEYFDLGYSYQDAANEFMNGQ